MNIVIEGADAIVSPRQSHTEGHIVGFNGTGGITHMKNTNENPQDKNNVICID